MKLPIKSLWADHFIRGTFVLTVANFIGSVLNYLVHPILARRLSIAEYGDYQALLSFVTIVGLVASVVGTTLIKEFSVLKDKDPEAASALRHKASKRLFLVGLSMFALIFIFSASLTGLFKISHPLSILFSSLILFYTFTLTVNRALLTAYQRFTALAANNLLDNTSRLLLVVTLVIACGLSLNGAAIAIGLSGLLSFAIIFLQVKKIGLPVFKGLDKVIATPWSYALLVLWFTALIQFFYNFDMLFIKSAFNQELAGLYGALLTIGRIVLFVGGSIPLVMFPVVANLQNDHSLRKYHVLGKSLALMSLLTLPACLFIALFPELIIKIVVGAKYLAIAEYLPAFAVIILLLTLLTVVAQYFIALSNRQSLVILSVGALLEIILLNLFHADLWQIIYSLGLVFTAINLSLGILFFNRYRAAASILRNNLFKQ